MVHQASMVRITGVLDALGIAHSSWYRKPAPLSERQRPGPAAQPIDEQIVRIVILTAELHPWYGYKKIAVIYRRAGHKVKNRHAYRVMREHGLLHKRRPSAAALYQASKLYELLPQRFTPGKICFRQQDPCINIPVRGKQKTLQQLLSQTGSPRFY